MNNDEKRVPAILQRLAAFKSALRSLGIAEEQIEEVSSLLEQHGVLQEELRTYRQAEQFAEDAAELLFRINGERGHNKNAVAATYLREFAEHVAACVASFDERQTADAVDRIPAMRPPPKEEKY